MDEFGRLPDDVLKYISFLGAAPKIDFVDQHLVITSPFYTQRYQLLCTKHDYNAILINTIDHFIQNKDAFADLFIGRDCEGNEIDLSIQVSKNTLIITNYYPTNTMTTLPLFLLSQLNNALLKYQSILKTLGV